MVASESEPEDHTTSSSYKTKKGGGFQSMGLDFHIQKGVLRRGYKVPTPIQRKTIPVIVGGKDVVAMARTGSGKTAAFLIPMLQKLKRRCPKAGARALLIAPTRELALQTMKFTKELGKYTDLKITLLVGGDNMEDQFASIHEKPDIIIATPGRLVHVSVEMNLKLTSIEYVVFDEADRLFEMGFEEQLKEVLARLPENRQTLLFSATLPKSLIDFVKAGLNDPTLVRLDVDSKISEKLDMSFLACRPEDKLAALVYTLRHVIDVDREQSIVFCATKHHVEYTYEVLCKLSFRCTFVYSSLDAVARKVNVEAFRLGKVRILLVTDLAARGVDIPLLDNVINLHFTPKAKLFVHRVGRVARAGRCGKAFSFVSAEEMPYVVDLFLFLGRPITLLRAPGGDGSSVTDGVGSFPRTLLEIEQERIKNAHDGDADLEYLRQGSANAHKQYVRTRPTPSRESVERVKREQMLQNLAVHPIFSSCESLLKTEETRSLVLQDLKSYKPKATVFELNASNKHQCCIAMKNKRKAHARLLTAPDVHKDVVADRTCSTDSHVTPVLADEPEVKNVFSEIIETKFRQSKDAGSIFEKNKARKAKKSATAKDADFFTPYQPKDFHHERGLALDKSGFERDMDSAVVDFTTDETADMRRQKNNPKWDRKRKRFVREDNSGKNKKIKTESGVWIPASYKTDMYSRWLKKSKTGHRGDDDEQPDSQRFTTSARHTRGKRGGAKGRPEMKSTEQILKSRRRKEKIEAHQTFGRQQNQKRGGKMSKKR